MATTRWREALSYSAMAFAFLAAFPKLSHRLRWPTRLGPRGLVAYIAFNTAVGFAVRTWAVPFVKRTGERVERGKEELRRELGREPTDQELLAHLGLIGDD